MPKSFSSDFGRSKGRPGPIVNVFRSKKDGKRSMPKMMLKFEVEKQKKNSKNQPNITNQSTKDDSRVIFGVVRGERGEILDDAG